MGELGEEFGWPVPPEHYRDSVTLLITKEIPGYPTSNVLPVWGRLEDIDWALARWAQVGLVDYTSVFPHSALLADDDSDADDDESTAVAAWWNCTCGRGTCLHVANLLISLDRLLLTSWRTGEWHPVLSQLLANTRVLCELHEEPISLASYPLMQRAVNDLLQRFPLPGQSFPDHHPLLLDMEDVSEVGYGQVSGAALRQWLGNVEESDERLVYVLDFGKAQVADYSGQKHADPILVVGVFLQQRGKNGKWTRGRRQENLWRLQQDPAHSAAITASDRILLQLLQRAELQAAYGGDCAQWKIYHCSTSLRRIGSDS